MTTKLTAAFAAGALAIGVLVGAAGAVLIHDATGAPMRVTDLAAMHEMMSNTDSSMMDGMMGPGTAIDPGRHEIHHPGSDR